ncbi:phosphatidylinositol-glycan biosynthesis class X protein isoform X1 [Scyliorhinus torazame]|uniref:phosphatidylinositol-glycan biosynthesis class X protein isoform X1 n=1 Tax=Scyliorhinus torazame TaxID=75743 RepID=UPI003B5B9048
MGPGGHRGGEGQSSSHRRGQRRGIDPLYSEPWLQSVSLNRRIVKDGFHRELVMDVELGEGAHQGCCIMIKAQLPQGLYVDPFELASLREHKGEEIFIQDEINIEAPEYLSTAHTIVVYLKPGPKHSGHFTGTVPVHVRYHRPTDTEEATALVTLANPQLMIRCQESNPLMENWKLCVSEAPCSANSSSTCSWMNVNYRNVVETLTLQVPVGQKKDVPAVITATLLATILCCSLLLRAVWIHGEFEH